MSHLTYDNQVGGVLTGLYHGVRFDRRMYKTGNKVHFTYVVPGYSTVRTSLARVKDFIDRTVLGRE